MNLASFEKTNFALGKLFICSIFLGLPLVITNGYFNISETKSLYFLIVGILYVSASLILYLISAIKKYKFPIRTTVLDIALIGFAVVTMISAAFSEYGPDVWIGKESRLQGALIILLYVAVYSIYTNTMPKAEEKDNAIKFLAISFIIVVLIAILHSLNISIAGEFSQIKNQQHLFISTIGNINFFGSYVCLCLPVFIVCFINSQNQDSYIAWLIVLILGGIAAVLTGSDSFALGFLMLLAVAPFFFLKSSKTFIRFWTAVLSVLLSATVFYYLYNLFPNKVYQPSEVMALIMSPVILGTLISLIVLVCVLARFLPGFLVWFRYIYLACILISIVAVIALFIIANGDNDLKVNSIFVFNDKWGNSRGKIYRKCFELIGVFSLKEWLIGIGPEALHNLYFGFDGKYYDQAHSEYLQILITTGLTGLASYLGIIAASIYVVVKKLRDNYIAVAFFLGLIAYWGQATVNIAQSFTTPFVYVYLAVICYEYNKLQSKRSK